MDSKHLLVDFKDSISPRQKRMLRRMVGKNNVAKDTAIIRDGNWVARKSVVYNDVFTRKLGKEFDSNILSRRHFPTISYSKDCFIEERLRSGFYTFEGATPHTNKCHSTQKSPAWFSPDKLN